MAKGSLYLRLRCLAAALLIITGPVWAGCLDRVAIIPLLSDGRPLIRASINGKAVEMFVDTGAQVSSVTPEIVAILGLPRDPHRRTLVTTVGGKDVSRNVILARLSLSAVRLTNRSVTVVALPGTSNKTPPAGVIGADVLSRFDLDLDIPRRTLTLYQTAGCTPFRPPWTGQYQTLSASVSGDRFLFPVELNGHTVTAQFDTGSRGESVSRATAKSIGITDSELDNDPSSSGASAGLFGYAIRRHRFDTFRIGTETFHNIRLDVTDFKQSGVDMLVGADYMHWRRFFIAYASDTLFIQREPDDAIRKALALRSQANSATDPCRPAPDVLPTLALKSAVAVSRPPLDLPKKARADHISGCAAVMFHLAPDGTPVEIKAVAESPTGYGLGAWVVRQLAATRFQPSPRETKWYYEVIRFHNRTW